MADPTSSQLSALSLGPPSPAPGQPSRQTVDKATLFKYRLEHFFRTAVGECIEREERAAEVERRVAGRPAGWSGDAAAAGQDGRTGSLASLAGLNAADSPAHGTGVWMSEERRQKIVRDQKRKVGVHTGRVSCRRTWRSAGPSARIAASKSSIRCLWI